MIACILWGLIALAIVGAVVWAEYLERAGDEKDALEALNGKAPEPKATFWVDGFPPG